MRRKFCIIIFLFCAVASAQDQRQMIVDSTNDVETEFGTYHPYVVDVVPQVAPYEVSPDFTNVANFSQIEFSAPDLAILRKNGFVVRPSHFCQIHDIYNESHDFNIPVFVTTDVVLHAYHILYDPILRILEVEQFGNDLDALNKAMVAAAERMVAQAHKTEVSEAARNVLVIAEHQQAARKTR